MDGSVIEARSGYDPAAIAARAAEINGKPQRIEPLAQEELGPEVKALVDDVQSSIGLVSPVEIDEFFRTLAKHPELFRGQLELGVTLFKGRLSVRERELTVLRVAWLLRAPYEWGEHVRIAKRYGVTPKEIEGVVQGSTAALWSAHERAILRGVEELLSIQRISDETWAVLAQSWDEPQLIEFPVVVGQYVSTALLQNALRMRLSDENPGLTGR